MSAITQEQFYEQHKDAEGNLSDQHTMEMMSLPVEGDTPATAEESSGKPDAAPEPKEPEAKAGDPAGEPKQDPTPSAADPEPVVLARDGKHTIPYSELADARQRATDATAALAVAQAKLTALEAEAQARADAGKTPTTTDQNAAAAQAAIDSGVDPAIFGDMSDEALAKGVKALAQQANAPLAKQLEDANGRIEALTKQVETLTGAVAPLQQHHQRSAQEEHNAAIYKAHADADAVLESPEFKAFIQAQPSFARDHYVAVLDKGTPAQVIELFSAFKAATKPAAAATAPVDAAASAEAAIAKAKAKTPTTLSDIPTGAAAHHDEAEALLEMSPTALMARFESMPQAKVNELLGRVL